MKKVITLFVAIFAIALSANAQQVSSKEAATFAESYYQMYECGSLSKEKFLDKLSKIAQPLPTPMSISLTPYAVGITTDFIGSYLDMTGGPSNIQTLLWQRWGPNQNRDSITTSESVPLGNTSWTVNYNLSNLATEMPQGKKYYVRSFIWYSGISPYYVDTTYYTVPPAATTTMNFFEKFFLGGGNVRFYVTITNNDPNALYWIIDNATGQTLMTVADTVPVGTNITMSVDLPGFTGGQTYTIYSSFTNTGGPGTSNNFTFTMPIALSVTERTILSSLDGVVVLYNILGAEVSKREVSHGTGDLSQDNLVTGVYFYRFFDKKGKEIQIGKVFLK